MVKKIDALKYLEHLKNLKSQTFIYFREKIIKNKDIDFGSIYDEATLDIESMLSETTEIDETIYEKLVNNKMSKKSKWLKYEFTNEKSTYKSILKKTEDMFKVSKICIDNCSSFTEFKDKLNEQLLNWNQKDVNLTDFIYLENKKKIAKKSAFLIDIKIFLLKEIVKNENEKLMNENKYEIQLNSLTNIPIDTTNKLKLTKKDETFVYECDSKGEQLQYFINLEDIKGISITEQAGKAISQVFKVLNDYDLKLFEFILKNRKPNFFKDGKITIVIKDACEYVFGYSSTTKKEAIVSSLIKMASLKVYAFSNPSNKSVLKGMTTSLLSSDMIFDEDTGKNIAVVIVGDIYRGEIINGNITKVYSHTLEKVKDNADAKKILFFLQRERIIRHYNRDKDCLSDDYLKDKVPYTYFSQSIVFTNKRKDRIKKRIQKGLDVIVQSESVLKYGKGSGDFFYLEYTPISEQEINDLENRIEVNENNNL